VWTVLQLRTHPELISLRERVREAYSGEKAEVTLSYITLRGAWYMRSWKGVMEKSGGVATNIGIHFFDLLIWIFGEVEGWELHHSSERTCAGTLELERARVTWLLSIDPAHLPEARHAAGERTYRSIRVDGEEVEFSNGFNDLHTEVYRRTLAGEGFGLEEARPSITLVQRLRTGTPTGIQPTSHPFLRNPGSS
jgi:UDP-N-acetyl-2-amino-2-deoxyglucuronate dehydrogenase